MLRQQRRPPQPVSRPGELQSSGPRSKTAEKSAVATLVASSLIIALAGQEGALAYGHFMYRAAESTPDVTWRGLALLIPLFTALGFLFLRHPWTRMPCGLGPLSLLFGVSTVASFWTATSTCLNSKYLLGDSLRFIAPWLTLILSYQAFSFIRRTQGTAAIVSWYDGLAVVALLDALVTLGFGLAFFGFHISNWYYIFLVGWVILSSRGVATRGNLILGLVLLTTVASGKRTNFVLVAFALVGALVLLVQRGGKVSRLCVTLAAMLCAGIIAQTLFAQYSGKDGLIEIAHRMFETINEIVIEGNHDRSYQLRVNETLNVMAHFERHPSDLVFGVGFGGEIPQIYDTGSATAAGNMHHVHKGYWLYLLRNGIVGLVLLAGFAWISTAGLVLARSTSPLITASCALYAATRMVGAFGGNLMMEDLDLPLVAGLGLAFVDPGETRSVAQRANARPVVKGNQHGFRGSH